MAPPDWTNLTIYLFRGLTGIRVKNQLACGSGSAEVEQIDQGACQRIKRAITELA